MRGRLGLVATALLLGACSGAGVGNGAIGGQPSIPNVSSDGSPVLGTATKHYAVTDLGPNVDPTHINDAGAVVGFVSTSIEGEIAFVWRAGTLSQLSPLSGYVDSKAKWINNSGEIVGNSFTFATNESRATQFVPGGAPIDLGVPAGFNWSVADSVNDSGLAAGAVAVLFFGAAPGGPVATFKGANSAAVINASFGGEAHAINNSGEIVGENCCPYGFPDENTIAFIYPPFTLLTMPADSGEGASAQDVNAKGDVVGFYSADLHSHSNPPCCGFYLHHGTLTEIDDPTRGSQGSLEALALNDSDIIVGGFGSTTSLHAFLYINHVIDLNTLIPANCNWVLQEATSINNRGQIVGTGTLGGVAHGFLLTPH